MMKALILFLSQAVFLFMNCLGQDREQPYLYLTDYTISKETNTIGYVRLSGAEIKSVTIDGENASAFKISKKHELVVRPCQTDRLPPRGLISRLMSKLLQVNFQDSSEL